MMVVFVMAIIVFYMVFYRGFWGGLMGGGFYLLMMLFLIPRKFVLTIDNMLESHYIFGKMNNRTIDISKIEEISVEKPRQLSVKYMKDGYKHASTLILDLSEYDVKEMQHELFLRNPNIIIH